MPDIFHIFPVNAPLDKVFEGISESKGLDKWWTRASSGIPDLGAHYRLNFGPEYHWTAEVTRFEPSKEFELTLIESHEDWQGTKVGFRLKEENGNTEVEFWHKGWPENNEHYRISSFCWAMYLRILKRYLEHGEVVPYKDRLNV